LHSHRPRVVSFVRNYREFAHSTQVRGRLSEERRGPPSARATRISVPVNFCRSPQKEFCNRIRGKADIGRPRLQLNHCGGLEHSAALSLAAAPGNSLHHAWKLRWWSAPNRRKRSVN